MGCLGPRMKGGLGSITLQESMIRMGTTKITLRKAFCIALEKTEISIRKAGEKRVVLTKQEKCF